MPSRLKVGSHAGTWMRIVAALMITGVALNATGAAPSKVSAYCELDCTPSIPIQIQRPLLDSDSQAVANGTDVTVLIQAVAGSSADSGIEVGSGQVSGDQGTVQASWDNGYQTLIATHAQDYVNSSNVMRLSVWYDGQASYGFTFSYYVQDVDN